MTNEVSIRKIERQDLEKRAEWINDPEINKTLTFDTPVSLASTEAWLSRSLSDPSKSHFSIIENSSDTLAGMCGFLNIDPKSRKAELYVTIGEKQLQGKGVAKKATIALLDHGFNNLGLQKIYLTTFTDNLRALNLYEQLGFIEEGTLRSEIYHRGEYRDLKRLSLLRTEFSQ